MHKLKALLADFGLENFNIRGNLEAQSINWANNTISYDFTNKMYTIMQLNKITGITRNYEYVFDHFISKGGYNDIKLCRYGTKEIVLRSAGEFTNRYESFMENVKTIFLYCYAKTYIPVKIFPDIYSFSYNKITKKYYLAMEYIPITFRTFIVGLHNEYINYTLLKIINIYDILDIHSLYFRHGDLTTNNILIYNGEPILIDFGMSSFYMFNEKYDSSDCLNYNKSGINLLHDMIILMNSLSFSGISITKLLDRRGDYNIRRSLIPQILVSGKVLHYFIRLFSNNLDKINERLEYKTLVEINDTLYFRKKTSLDLSSPEAIKIFRLITKKAII